MNVFLIKSGRMALCAMFAATIMWSCSDSENNATDGFRAGYIVPASRISTEVHDLQATATVADEVTADMLSIALKSADGKFNRTYQSLDEFNTDERFAIGSYTMTASYGTEESEGFNAPYYYGSETFTVNDGESVPVEIVATLSNCMVSVEPTEAFRQYFRTKFHTTLHSAGGSYIDITADETRPAYLRPGKITVTGTMELPSTGKEVTLEIGTFDAEARTLYHVTLDVNGEHGSAELVVTFDESTELKPVTITLSADLTDAPAPTLTLKGSTEGMSVHTVTTVPPTEDLRVDVNCPGTLRSLILTTTGAPALLAAGWPAEFDLAAPNAEQQELMARYGLRTPGATMDGARYASVVLTDMIASLRDPAVTFTVRATDTAGRSSAPVSASVELDPLIADLESASALSLLSDRVNVRLTYNGNVDPISLTYSMCEKGSEDWQPVSAIKATPLDSENAYEVTLPVGQSSFEFSLRAETELGSGKSVDVSRSIPDTKISVTSGYVWATKAYVSLTCDELTAAQTDSLATFYLSSDGGKNWKKTDARRQANGLYLISGLTARSDYSVKASLVASENRASAPATFKTETASQVPNGDFETLTETINYQILQGYYWTITAGGAHRSTLTDMVISEPTGWASTNCKTCYLDIDGTVYPISSWYQVPSVYNTTLTWLVHQPTAKILGIGQNGYDEVPPIYDNLTAASGANAMVIRNVAWDNQGQWLDVDSKTGNTSYSNYYCEIQPQEFGHRSAGKLFLGSNSFNGYAEHRQPGVDFASRPTTLTGSYKYEPDVNDPDETGLVTVELRSGNKTIGSGSLKLGPQSAYTSFEVPITYTDLSLRATSLRIEFSSSNRTDETRIITTNYCNKQECVSRGAALTVDNLKFTY